MSFSPHPHLAKQTKKPAPAPKTSKTSKADQNPTLGARCWSPIERARLLGGQRGAAQGHALPEAAEAAGPREDLPTKAAPGASEGAQASLRAAGNWSAAVLVGSKAKKSRFKKGRECV